MCRYTITPAICVLHHEADESMFLRPIEHSECPSPIEGAHFCTNEPHQIIITGSYQSLFGKLSDQKTAENLDWGLCHKCDVGMDEREDNRRSASVGMAVNEADDSLQSLVSRFGVGRETKESPEANFVAVRHQLRDLRSGLEKTVSRLRRSKPKHASAAKQPTSNNSPVSDMVAEAAKHNDMVHKDQSSTYNRLTWPATLASSSKRAQDPKPLPKPAGPSIKRNVGQMLSFRQRASGMTDLRATFLDAGCDVAESSQAKNRK